MKVFLPKLLPKFIGAAALYGLALFLEGQRPLRRPTQPKLRRVVRNLVIGAIGSLTLRLGFYGWLLWLARHAAQNSWGLLSLFDVSQSVRTVFAFLFLDYTLYFWHWANHKVPFLWRFHNAHHVDLDLDISTGSRFHFGELVFSVGARAAEIAAFGIDPLSMLIYDTVSMVAVHFHHSNIRLPERLERALNLFLVTPRMHGIHHSIVRGETDSNFSTVFSFWDRLHRSFKAGIPQEAITIGVPSYRDPEELTLFKVLVLPFSSQRPWQLRDGTVPHR